MVTWIKLPSRTDLGSNRYDETPKVVTFAAVVNDASGDAIGCLIRTMDGSRMALTFVPGASLDDLLDESA